MIEIVFCDNDSSFLRETFLFAARVGRSSCPFVTRRLLVDDIVWYREEACISRNAMGLKSLLHMQMAFGPFASWRIRAENNHTDGSSNNENKRYNEGYPPGDVRSKML